MLKNAYNVKARSKVICVHIGARAHYLIPKALQQSGVLEMLITDTWISNSWMRRLLSSLPSRMFKSLSARYTNSIPSYNVKSFGIRFLWKEFWLRFFNNKGWELIIARNIYFEHTAEKKMKSIGNITAVFALSYTARKVFEQASVRGLRKVLYQMDPGVEEENIVANLKASYNRTTSWQRAPETYWKNWLLECNDADAIMVNSVWSKTALVQQGILKEKIHVIPLPFEIKTKHTKFIKNYPKHFNKERPLKCLFLGTLSLRKGAHLVLEAAQIMLNEPVEFIFVGETELQAMQHKLPNVIYKGVVTRAETDSYYQTADVFLFPTFSDGFGLTQLEAMAWQLPVIASDRCGEVVRHSQNGWLLKQLETEEIVRIVSELIQQPEKLMHTSMNCLDTVKEFNLASFSINISRLV